MTPAVILAAGRSTRLGGRCKLLVDAAGAPVCEWHRRALGGMPASAVVRPEDAAPVLDAAPWLESVVMHGALDGPAGALLAFLRHDGLAGPVTVLFADTLLPSVPDADGDWAGVAPAPWRVWDYQDAHGRWTRGTPRVTVCCGVYRFTDRGLLAAVIESLASSGDVPMASVLDRYSKAVPVQPLYVTGWQDAGDDAALAAVRDTMLAPLGAWESRAGEP